MSPSIAALEKLDNSYLEQSVSAVDPNRTIELSRDFALAMRAQRGDLLQSKDLEAKQSKLPYDSGFLNTSVKRNLELLQSKNPNTKEGLGEIGLLSGTSSYEPNQLVIPQTLLQTKVQSGSEGTGSLAFHSNLSGIKIQQSSSLEL